MRTNIYSILTLIFLIFFSQALHAQALQDTGWPKTIENNGNQLLIYQPQMDDWKDGAVLTGKTAVQLIPSGSSNALTGVLWFKAETAVNKTERTVLIHNLTITKATFYEKDPTKEAEAETLAKSLLPQKPITISLDRMLAQINTSKQVESEIPLNTTPPKIFVSTVPARLVLFDGKPLWNEIKDTNLTYAVNTNWNVFFQPSSKHYYLLDDTLWVTSDDLNQWQPIATLPDDFNKLPADDNWSLVKQALPPKANNQQVIPKYFVSTEPAELIVIDGAPKLRLIPGTQLSVVDNTKSDLFYYQGDKNYYFLVTGRWFKSASLDGPWVFATSDLPADFAKIPDTDTKGQVLASVPGTEEAKTAVAEAEIPTLATVKKNEVSLTVQYAGTPEFKPIPGTSLEYAVNTQTTVIKVGSQYYALSNGIWFVSTGPNGPWVVADSIPPEIYKIPPTAPVYNATYVKIYGTNPAANEVIVGYTAGYTGALIFAGVLVWGTGYYYSPYYVLLGPYRPVYYPWFHTYGMATYYSPYYGVYYRSGYFYGPYGGINSTAIYNPATGGYYHGVYAYGPYSAGRAFVAYNPTTGVHAAGYQRWTPYASWGRGVVSKGDEWAKGGYYSGPNVTAGHIEGSGGQSASAAKVKGGDLYVGNDGNVYRRDSDGNWEEWDDGSWKPIVKDENKQNQLQGTQDKRQDQKNNLQNKQDQRQNQQGNLQNRQDQRQQNNLTQTQQTRKDQMSNRQETKQGTRQQKRSSTSVQGLNQEYGARNRGNYSTSRYQQWQSSGSNPRSLSGANYEGGGRFEGGGRRR